MTEKQKLLLAALGGMTIFIPVVNYFAAKRDEEFWDLHKAATLEHKVVMSFMKNADVDTKLKVSQEVEFDLIVYELT